MKRSVDGLLYDIIAYLKANENERSNSIFLKRCEEAYSEQLILNGVVKRCPHCGDEIDYLNHKTHLYMNCVDK